MDKTTNLRLYLKDIADTIRSKTGKTDLINAQDFSSEIASLQNSSKSKWTGHADAEGLKAIGWTDEDITYYQENGVNWNEEDDEYHKVTDDNKELYGVLTADNISTYWDTIVYLPKIDTSNVINMRYMFNECRALVSIPQLDTSNVTNMAYTFNGCKSLVSIPQLDTRNVIDMASTFSGCVSLVSIPQLDTSKVTNMKNMFSSCYSLVSIPQLDTSKVTNMEYMFSYCYSLVSIPQLNTSNVINMRYMFSYCHSLVSIPQLDTSNVTNMAYMFNQCYSLVSIPQLDTSNVTNMASTFKLCYSLTHANIINIKTNINFDSSPLLSKGSLLYLINNEASTAAFAITLKAYAYDKWSVDADVITALEAHPNVSLTRTT